MKGHLVRSWWVYAFCLLSTSWTLYAAREKQAQALQLSCAIDELHREKEEALRIREEHLLQIHSHDDPRWIEMVLMQKLGLVPENSVKIYFHPQ